jgi:hypothetical protein
MHRFLPRGLTAVAAAGWLGWAGSSALAADPPASAPPPAESRSFFSRLNPFGGDEPAPASGPRLRKPVGPLSSETMVSVLQAERDAYTRRIDVCLRLHEIALATKDEALEAKANELEKQVNATYQARVARLGVKSGGPLPPLPAASAGVLDRTLGTGVAVNPLTAGKKPTATDKTATAKANQFKEVNP